MAKRKKKREMPKRHRSSSRSVIQIEHCSCHHTPTFVFKLFSTLNKEYGSCINYVYTYSPVGNAFLNNVSSFKSHNILLKLLKFLGCNYLKT